MGTSEAMSKTSSRISDPHHRYLIVILGPTAVGKSAMAVRLAQRFGSSIINADSRQFYREMRIGTARPSESEQQDVPHYMLGDRSIEDPITAAEFEQEGLELLNELFEEQNPLFLVGGSGFYSDALLEGLDSDLPPPDPDVREELEKLYSEEGLEGLLERLRKGDPEHYEKMDRNNPRRVIRALEVLWVSGHPLSEFRGKKKASRPFTPVKIGLWTERSELHQRIENRTQRMLDEGLLDEVRSLLPYRDRRPLQTVGYQEFFPYLDGETDLESARERMERNTRRYAKRQMTWFRRDPDIEWFGPDEEEGILRRIEERTGLTARSDRAPSGT